MKKLFVTLQTQCERVCILRAFRHRLLIPAALFGFSPMVSHANQIVSTSQDSGNGSLRQAIADVSGGGEISFAPTLGGQTIVLTSELIIGKSLTINATGLATGLTLSGGGARRLIQIGTGHTVTLRGLTFSGGNGTGAVQGGFGGALFSSGTTTVDRCRFIGNTAGNYGGAIHNDLNSTLTVDF